MRFHDALALLFRWLPMRCLFTILAFIDFTIGRGGRWLLCGWGDVSVVGGDGLSFIFGDGLLFFVRRRCSGLGGRLCHLPDGGHWGVPSCLSLVDAGRRPEDPGVRRAAG